MMDIPPYIIEVRAKIKAAIIDENVMERRRLLTGALASIDWLSSHCISMSQCYQQIRAELMAPELNPSDFDDERPIS